MVNLDELMRLHAEATPGPWKVTFGAETETYAESNGKIICETTYLGPDYDDAYRDAAYIVAACNAVPELVARIREMESEIKRRDAYKLAEICNACTDDRFCPYIGPCPFGNKKRGDITPEDWIKRLEVKQ